MSELDAKYNSQKINEVFNLGRYLFATCSADYYGEVLEVSPDQPYVRIKIYHAIEDILTTSCEGYSFEYGTENDFPVIVSGVEITYIGEIDWDETDNATGYMVSLDTPGDGCFRCTRNFILKKSKD